ncbi:hypothetical protein [Burkholderia pseudomallei]|uniref:hypothetical protein n=1 Tax=Burkholderia pseudomallei TaxID=28450 RepID=UPI000A94C194|nr:hypothetical protein [Burkholderia pseudomallei]
MNTRHARMAVLSTLLLAASAVSFAAAGSSSSSAAQDREHGHGSMMMGGMMGGCPMMGGSAGLDPKTAMRMHAEMMRAMSDIMMKYSDQAGAAPSK